MITIEEYLQAVKIIEAFHKQINGAIEMPPIEKNVHNVKAGDYVKCIEKRLSTSPITVGETFRVIRVQKESWSYGPYMTIRLNKGGHKHYYADERYWQLV